MSLRSAKTLHLGTTDAGNELLARDPLALLVGMLLDQQIPMEKAFTSPVVLAERLGVAELDARAIAELNSEVLENIFRQPPALHRFPAAMAKRVQALCTQLVRDYEGSADPIWLSATSGTDLVDRITALPSFGAQKAKIFTALLGKQLGVQPAGWRAACEPYGDAGAYRSVADVVDAASLQRVRAFKQQQKAAAKSV